MKQIRRVLVEKMEITLQTVITSYKMTDNYTPDILRRRYNAFKLEVATTKEIRESTGIPIRSQNPPEDITENIVKNVIHKFEGDTACRWAKSVGCKGDLVSGSIRKEVKAFMSPGPSSFGPRKEFDDIYFLDIRRLVDDHIVVHKVNLTNESPEWRNMRVNANETFADQCAQGRRPHIAWDAIHPQIADHCVILYEGPFEGIFREVAPVAEPLA
jgi:hypothetical protein